MKNSSLIPPGDYLRLLSLLAHILTLKRKEGHALRTLRHAVPSQATAISCFCFSVSRCLYISLALPLSVSPSLPLSHSLLLHCHGLITVQRLCHADPYLTLREIILSPSNPPKPPTTAAITTTHKGGEPHVLLCH